MPQVVNGCGTWYYGKKNVQQYEGVCRACHQRTTLKSYDTRLYVVFLMVPIFPLGRKRIIEECAACRRHHAASLAEYRKVQERARQAIDAFCRKPGDADLAEEVISACLGFRDLTSFLEVAPQLEAHQANSARILKLLAGTHDAFGRLADCERVLSAALQAEDEDETREMLADCLIRQDRPDEAAPYVQHIIDDGIPDRVDHLYQLAQAYQLRAEHDKALALFDHCERILPAIAEDATFSRLRAESTKRLGTNVAVKPSEVVKLTRRKASWKKFRKTAPLVLAVAVLAYLSLAWIQGLRREVFVVNGLHRPYTVRLQGKEYKLNPQQVTKVRTGEGDLEFEILDLPAPAATQKVRVQSGFLTRPFRRHTFVLNPDGAAILRRTRVHYSARSSEDAEPETLFAAGDALHEFSGIHYAFEEFPESISVESHSSRTTRDGLFLVKDDPNLTRATLLLLMAHSIGHDAAAGLARQHLLLEPERSEYLTALHQLTTPKERAEFLRQALDRRPVQIAWHRVYQGAMSGCGGEEEVEAQYETMLAKEPTSKDLLYLAGRVSKDLDKRFSRYEQAASGDSPCPYAVFAMCGRYLSTAQFTEAAAQAHRVFQMLPDEEDVQWYCRQALVAAGQEAKAIEMLKKDESKPLPVCLGILRDEAYLQTVLGQTDEVRKTIDRLRVRLTEWDEAEVERDIRQIEAQLAYATGNPAEYVKTFQDSPQPEDRLAAWLTAGDLDAAAKASDETEANTRNPLLVYIAAMADNNKELAERHLKAAIDLMSKGDFEDRAYAAALSGKPTMSTKDLLRLLTRPREKVVILTALGLQDPANRAAYFELAAKLNFDRRFPYLLIKQVTSSQPS
jgi:tetratricopeptide (TPR) repeat protein